MKFENIQTDITVIGGGLAGVSAAVAAARLGCKVALVQNRPVLGGNSSSEVRVWVCGATAHGIHRYARETGIIGEMMVENQFRNPEGNPYYWDSVVLETVRAEPNIQLFLNTDVHEVEAEGVHEGRSIKAVIGWMMGSERKIRFESKQFIDCTGDGLVGYLAGADYRLGREGREELHEPWAPEKPDSITLGSTLLFYTRDEGKKVKYVPPAFARDITTTSIPIRRVIRSGDNGCAYWWIEWGGELDTVHENERIRDELQAVIYGVWDYIKNSGKFDADTMTLEWVGSIPGKREYRRFEGDYMITQHDIVAQREFIDRVSFGGWSIDLHPPQGMYAQEDGSKHYHTDGIYHIPFRSLYSRNVRNMLMAGRNISASHVAFGTTRVMATCAANGEAAGTGAALCVQLAVTPRELQQQHLEVLQQTLLRQDASVIGLKNQDTRDLARQAQVAASSCMTQIKIEQSDEVYELATDFGILFPVDQLDGLELLLDVHKDTRLQVELWATGRPENYIPYAKQLEVEVRLSAGGRQWSLIPLQWHPEAEQNAFIVIKANAAVGLHLSHEPHTGVLSFVKTDSAGAVTELGDKQVVQPVVQWTMSRCVRKPACLRLLKPTGVFHVSKLLDGYLRPYGGPHMWISEKTTDEQWLQYHWPQPVMIHEIHLVFNDDVNEDLNNLHHHRTPHEVMPELVKSYKLQIWHEDGWEMVCAVTDNRRRKRVHRLEQPAASTKLRIVLEETNGCSRFEVIEVRVY